jgi:mono/diheme cytochrome c family protein
MGGERLGEEMGFPGTFYPKNITPAGIGNWTDGELLRMITSGVNKKGRAVFPLMPYPHYNNLSQEDVYSIIAYIRTLKPIQNPVQESSVNFPLNFILRTIPAEYQPKPAPDRSNSVKYGEYLVTVAACSDCHTMAEKGEPVKGMYLAGGFEFKLPNGTLHSANITPDPATGIGGWSKEFFIKRFKFYSSESARTIAPDPSGFNTIMPWTMFAGMSEQDLGSIYDYLRTVPPVSHKVEKWIKQKNYDMPVAAK